MHLRPLFLAVVFFAFHGAVGGAERPSGAPNVVFIFADDLGYGDLSCYGAQDIATPHIDGLARNGTRFTNFYVAQAVCTASRAALMTGCYSNRVGLGGALNHTSPNGINQREKILPELFREQGYATSIYGKWHLGHHLPFLPTRHGFGEWLGIPYPNDVSPLHPTVRNMPALPFYENEEIIEADPDMSQFTRRLTERSVAFLEANRDKPFFLYVPHIMPHVPIFASERFRGTSKRGLYGDVVQELDWGVGEILAALRRLGLDDNTLVMFSSDNGPFLSYGDHAGSPGILREGKLTTFEGGVRMPFLARWPGRVPAGRVSDEMITAMDLYVTWAKMIGAKLPDVKLDGIDVSAVLFGRPGAKGRSEFWYYAGDELQAVREGDWKLHVPHEYLTVAAEPGRGGKPSNFANIKPGSMEQSGLRGIASRHGYRVEKMELTLYNLKDDPGETKNVADAHPDIVARLQQVVAKARADLGDSLTGVASRNTRPAGDIRSPLPAGVKRIANLTYSTPPRGAQLLDLYLPEAKPERPLPVVMWVHGGGWKNGSKENCPLTWLAAEGFAVASINYRLTHVASWPAQIEDCRAAVRWLRANAEKYQLDGSRLAVSGGSAGGQLAAVLGTSAAPQDEAGSSRVQAVIDLYGPTDLLTMPANMPGPNKTDAELAKANGAKLLGGIVRDRPQLARAASALHQVSGDDPPFLILHGDQDPQVPLDQSKRLHARLQEAKVPSELRVIAGAGHGGKQFDTPEVRDAVRAFLSRALARPAAGSR